MMKRFCKAGALARAEIFDPFRVFKWFAAEKTIQGVVFQEN